MLARCKNCGRRIAAHRQCERSGITGGWMEDGEGGNPAEHAHLRESLKGQPEDLVLAFPKGDGEALVRMHKALGMACSTVIKSRLTGEWKVSEDELDGQPVPRIDVPVGDGMGRIPENGLLKLVNFWYEGTLQLSEDEDQGITDALDVYAAGDFMQAWKSVEGMCVRHLVKCTTVHTWQRLCVLLTEDVRFQAIAEHVRARALQCAAWNFVRVVTDPLWNRTHPKQVVALFKDPNLVNIEDRILGAALVWVAGNKDASAEDVYAILEAVRLPQVSDKLMAKLKALPVVIASAECQGLLAEAAAWVKGSGGGRLRASARVRAKKSSSSYDETSSLGLVPGSRSAARAEPRLWGPRGHRSLVVMTPEWAKHYDVSMNTWSNLSPPVGVLNHAAATSLGGLVYMAGGGYGMGVSAQVTCFDPAAANGLGTYFAVAPMSTARETAPAMAALNGLLYVSGGRSIWSGPFDSRSAERYSPASDTWEAVASMTSERYHHQLVAMGGFLYAIGGRSGDSSVASAERYDPATNSWTLIASMAIARSYFAAAAMGGFLYVTGGIGEGPAGGPHVALRRCERYDPGSNTWSRIADLPEPRCGHALACLDGSLYAVGGPPTRFGTLTLSTSRPWRYDVSLNTWAEAPPLAAGSVQMSWSPNWSCAAV